MVKPKRKTKVKADARIRCPSLLLSNHWRVCTELGEEKSILILYVTAMV